MAQREVIDKPWLRDCQLIQIKQVEIRSAVPANQLSARTCSIRKQEATDIYGEMVGQHLMRTGRTGGAVQIISAAHEIDR